MDNTFYDKEPIIDDWDAFYMAECDKPIELFATELNSRLFGAVSVFDLVEQKNISPQKFEIQLHLEEKHMTMTLQKKEFVKEMQDYKFWEEEYKITDEECRTIFYANNVLEFLYKNFIITFFCPTSLIEGNFDLRSAVFGDSDSIL